MHDTSSRESGNATSLPLRMVRETPQAAQDVGHSLKLAVQGTGTWSYQGKRLIRALEALSSSVGKGENGAASDLPTMQPHFPPFLLLYLSWAQERFGILSQSGSG